MHTKKLLSTRRGPESTGSPVLSRLSHVEKLFRIKTEVMKFTGLHLISRLCSVTQKYAHTFTYFLLFSEAQSWHGTLMLNESACLSTTIFPAPKKLYGNCWIYTGRRDPPDFGSPQSRITTFVLHEVKVMGAYATKLFAFFTQAFFRALFCCHFFVPPLSCTIEY